MTNVPEDIQIGLYYRSSPGYYDDCDPKEPTNFTVDSFDAPVFPAALLNTSEGGSGGSEAINEVYEWKMADPPQFRTEGRRARQEGGANGKELCLRIKQHPNILETSLNFPQQDVDGADYEDTWRLLQELAYGKAYLWVLHRNWAFRGYIVDADDAFLGAYAGDVVVPVRFGIKRLYAATLSGSDRQYVIFDPS